ncbi:hypothetical protein BFG60_4224 [Microcystis aeruginosa NIES-98]|nr:hypothetical protein BFG60_4224 [Microcystis aeruginosa NIES-98]
MLLLRTKLTAISIFPDMVKNELNKNNFLIFCSIKFICSVYIAKYPANE